MLVVVVGVSHRTAPVAVRERLAREVPQLDELRDRCRELHPAAEVVRLSTCNRLELYLAVPRGVGDRTILELGAELVGGEAAAAHRYRFTGAEAARHLHRVAASLDSQVLGEDQILGQVKEAYHRAVELGVTGPYLNHLFHAAFRIAKRVRTETDIARSPVSLASAAVRLAGRVYGELETRRVLCVGVGEMTRVALQHLRDRGVDRFEVANRTPARAATLAEEFGADVVGLEELEEALGRADLVLAATGADRPVIAREQVEAALARRGAEPLLLVDLGIPRDVEPGVDELEGAYLYNLDDLEQITSETRAARERAARLGEELVAEEVTRYDEWLRARQAAPVIEELRTRARELARRELARSLRKVEDLSPEQLEACQRALTSTVEKVLHHPMVALRGLGADEEGARTLAVVRSLFGLRSGGADAEDEEEPGGLAEVGS